MLGLKISVLVCTAKITKFSRHNKFSAHKKNKQRIPTGVQHFYVNLESSCLCLIQRTLGELPVFEVTICKPFLLLYSALICFLGNSLYVQGNTFFK